MNFVDVHETSLPGREHKETHCLPRVLSNSYIRKFSLRQQTENVDCQNERFDSV